MKQGCMILATVVGLVFLFFFLGGCQFDERIGATNKHAIDCFEQLVVDESTMEDVYSIAVPDRVYYTSFGAVMEYALDEGNWIQIEVYGPKKVVGSIIISEDRWADLTPESP